jgi:hypothetical protein
MSDYRQSVVACAAVLTIKAVVVNLWTVRARLIRGTFNFKVEASNLLAPILKPVGSSPIPCFPVPFSPVPFPLNLKPPAAALAARVSIGGGSRSLHL